MSVLRRLDKIESRLDFLDAESKRQHQLQMGSPSFGATGYDLVELTPDFETTLSEHPESSSESDGMSLLPGFSTNINQNDVKLAKDEMISDTNVGKSSSSLENRLTNLYKLTQINFEAVTSYLKNMNDVIVASNQMNNLILTGLETLATTNLSILEHTLLSQNWIRSEFTEQENTVLFRKKFDESLAWLDAKAKCEAAFPALNSHLAIIKDEKERESIMTIRTNDPETNRIWIDVPRIYDNK